MTEKLFYEDSYIKEFQARVLSCRESGGGYQAVLTRTAFFPEGGGQSADTGFLYTEEGTEIRVTDVQEKEGVVYHISLSLSGKGQRYRESWTFRSVFQKCSSIQENISFQGW